MLTIPIQTKQQAIEVLSVLRIECMKKLLMIMSIFLISSFAVSGCQVDGQNSVLVDLVSDVEVPFNINSIQIIVNDGEEEAFLDFQVPKQVPIKDSDDERFAFVLDFAPQFAGKEANFEIIGFQDGVNVLSTRQETAFIGNGLVQIEISVGFCTDSTVNKFRNEECEDGNLIDGDGCDSNCTFTACENGIASPGEFCYATTPVTLPGDSTFIVSGDVNNDGNIDLINAESDGLVRIFLNNGDKSFSLFDTFKAGNLSFIDKGISLGDLDNDNNLDLVLLNAQEQSIEIFVNDGTGNFVFSDNFLLGSFPIDLLERLVSLETADVNGDNFIDIIAIRQDLEDQNSVLASSSIIIRLNDGRGSFETQRIFTTKNPNSIALGDFDNDQDLDLSITSVLENEINLLENNGNAEFTLIDTISTIKPQVVALQDINDNGDLDFIVGNRLNSVDSINTISIFTNNGRGNFDLLDTPELPEESGIPSSLDFGDFDNDGDFDLIVSDFSSSNDSRLHIFLNDSFGQFTFEKTFNVNSFQVLAKDLNQDGVPDLISNSSIFFSIP